MISALLVLWLAAATPLEQAERAVMEGQNALQQQRYADAARVLQEGVEAAAAIDNPEVRTQALAAIHFFSALAYSHVGEMGRAREEIEWFLIYSPATKSVDKSQYPEPFVTAFVEVSNAVRAMRPSEFDRRYPGYRLFSTEVPEHSSWEPAARYLATPEELDAWKAPIGEEARERFLDEFWTRRDPTPKTEENEFRALFEGRVAFADRAFAGPSGERGAITDRGRVLVLLGKPREVMFEKPGSERGVLDDGSDPAEFSASSEVEIWGYDREQLPVRIRDRSFLFRFIDDVNQDFILRFSSEYERVLTGAAAKARERR